MLLKQTNEYSKITHWNDIITSIYLPALLAMVNYTKHLFKLGKNETFYVILLLAIAEIIKYAITQVNQSKINRKSLLKNLPKTITVLMATFGLYYVIAVLLGAPAFSNYEETSMFSLLLVTVTTLPLCLNLGPENTINMLLTITQSQDGHKCFMVKLRLTLLGAWLGATVVPLDWDRPWQVWPIPCYLGTLVGYLTGNIASVFLQAKKIKKTRKTVL